MNKSFKKLVNQVKQGKGPEIALEYSIKEKIITLLKHDSQCAVEKTGVCNCWFFDVASQLVKLFKIYGLD